MFIFSRIPGVAMFRPYYRQGKQGVVAVRHRMVRCAGESAFLLIVLSGVVRFSGNMSPNKDAVSSLLILAAATAIFIGTTKLNDTRRP